MNAQLVLTDHNKTYPASIVSGKDYIQAKIETKKGLVSIIILVRNNFLSIVANKDEIGAMEL